MRPNLVYYWNGYIIEFYNDYIQITGPNQVKWQMKHTQDSDFPFILEIVSK